MGLVSKPWSFSAGNVIIAAEHNDNFDTIYNAFNGNIENVNIKSTAAISDSKLATISTAGKVNLGALIATGQAAGDFVYYTTANAWAVFHVGTANNVLTVNTGNNGFIWK